MWAVKASVPLTAFCSCPEVRRVCPLQNQSPPSPGLFPPFARFLTTGSSFAINLSPPLGSTKLPRLTRSPQTKPWATYQLEVNLWGFLLRPAFNYWFGLGLLWFFNIYIYVCLGRVCISICIGRYYSVLVSLMVIRVLFFFLRMWRCQWE